MSKSRPSHTPGPWRFAGSGIITNQSGDEIILGNIYDDPDAALISAAPELLSILDDLMSGTRMEISPQMQARVIAVLRKARGIE